MKPGDLVTWSNKIWRDSYREMVPALVIATTSRKLHVAFAGRNGHIDTLAREFFEKVPEGGAAGR